MGQCQTNTRAQVHQLAPKLVIGMSEAVPGVQTAPGLSRVAGHLVGSDLHGMFVEELKVWSGERNRTYAHDLEDRRSFTELRPLYDLVSATSVGEIKYRMR